MQWHMFRKTLSYIHFGGKSSPECNSLGENLQSWHLNSGFHYQTVTGLMIRSINCHKVVTDAHTAHYGVSKQLVLSKAQICLIWNRKAAKWDVYGAGTVSFCWLMNLMMSNLPDLWPFKLMQCISCLMCPLGPKPCMGSWETSEKVLKSGQSINLS